MVDSLEAFFQDLEWRKIIANSANWENVKKLNSEEKVVYLGIDCTAETLHIGHLFLLLQTVRFAKEGFQILLVLGGATSKIGDPSDKLQERPQLQLEQISDFQAKIREQLERILIKSQSIEEVATAPLESFYADNPELLRNIHQILKIDSNTSNKKKWEKYLSYVWPLTVNKFQILNNNDWLGKISFVDFINQVGRNISIGYLLAKETIKQRVNSETGLSYLAFSYSLLQAYDFYYLYENYNCRGQLGGSDQWGNLTTGLKLIRSFYPEEKNKSFAVTFSLLADQAGQKYSKSESNKKTLRLNSSPTDFYEFFRNMPDEQAQTFIKQFTFLEENQINALLKLNNPPQLRILQRILYELIYWLNYREIEKT